jgi:histidyl-tRNA synthetase
VKLDIPRGMRDLDAKEYSDINYIRNHFIRTASLFNFKLHQPSTLEMMSTLEAKGGSAISNEIYNFKDKGGRDIALRFDLTVGLTRHIARRRELKLPIKVAAFGGVWRYDEPQAGRYRHFHQWDVEIYDTYNLEHEAEIIQLVAYFFKELRLDVTIDINHRELLEQYIRKKLGLSDPHLSLEIFRAIDKVQKKGQQAVFEEYEHKIKPSILKPLLELSTVVGTVKDIEDQNLEISKLSRWKTICELVDSLSLRGVSNTRINLGVVRGLDYYSGIVFEILDPSFDMGALAGGGRYDTLTSAFNRRDIGAIGVAGGVERLLSALSHHGLIKMDNNPLVFVVSENKGLVFRIVSELRCDGIPADYDSRCRPIRKQLEYAASIGASIVVMIEQEHGVSHTVKAKSLMSGLEMEGRIDQTRSIVQDLLKTST